MTVNWDDYEPFDPGGSGLPEELPRRRARELFERLMRDKTERIEMLSRLLAANGLNLSCDDAGLQRLNDWFVRHVEPDPQRPGRLRPVWYALATDIGLLIGEALINRCPGLRWEFFTWGKKNAAYQRHVIMGFTRSADAKYNIDIERPVAALGVRVTSGLPVEPDMFLRLVKHAQDMC